MCYLDCATVSLVNAFVMRTFDSLISKADFMQNCPILASRCSCIDCLILQLSSFENFGILQISGKFVI